MNTFLAHLVVSISITLIVIILMIGAIMALTTVFKTEKKTTSDKQKIIKPIADIENLDIGTMFKKDDSKAS